MTIAEQLMFIVYLCIERILIGAGLKIGEFVPDYTLKRRHEACRDILKLRV